jgi:hypothetical protein
MADRFKSLVLNAPNDCNIGMIFGFQKHLPIDEFLTKINIPHLFRNTPFWQGARFRFHVHGVDQENNFIDMVTEIYVDLLHFHLEDVSCRLHSEFNMQSRYWFDEPPKVGRMEVYFR